MGNLITEKLLELNLANKNINLPGNISSVEISDNNNINKPLNENNNNKYIIPGLILGAGGILLYLGVISPSKIKYFRKDVDQRMNKMSDLYKDFLSWLDKTLKKSFPKSEQYIQEFYENYELLSNAGFKQALKDCNSVQEVINLLKQQLKYLKNPEQTKPGASYFDEFKTIIGQERRNISEEINGKKHRVKQEIDDCTDVLTFKNKSHEAEVNASKESLKKISDTLKPLLDKDSNEVIDEVIEHYSRFMKDAVVSFRRGQKSAQDAALNAAKSRISEIADENSELFQIPLERLSPQELKPHSNLKFSKESFGAQFLNIIKTTDFSQLKDKDIEQIFNSLSGENLNDLRHLIEITKLEQSYIGAKPDRALIAKLEFLYKKLYATGETQIMIYCDKDFNKLEPQKLAGEIRRISDISKKLGFESLEKMNEFYSKNNFYYAKLGINDFIEKYSQNPNKYFS